MKFVVGVIFGVLIAVQAPSAWEAWQKAQQCDDSMAKQMSSSLAKAHPDLDVIDCSFRHFYGEAIRDLLGLK